MKNLLFLTISTIVLFTSCRYNDCTYPSIYLKFETDSSKIMVFNFDTYEKGTDFSKLISSEKDSVYLDTSYGRRYRPYKAEHAKLSATYDYIINIPATGKEYKITDIFYSGKRQASTFFATGERYNACTRTVNYTVNGELLILEGQTYVADNHGPEGVTITITK